MSLPLTSSRELRARVPILLLGASTAILQTLAVREGMASSGGNEAVVGSLFGIWMLLTAGGAASGRRAATRSAALPIALALHAVSIPTTILAARAATGLMTTGSAASLSLSTLAALVILAPSCLLAGWLYSRLAAGLVSGDRQTTPGNPGDCSMRVEEGRASANAYLLDTLGAGLAGAVLALWVLDRTLPFQAAGWAAACSLAGAAALSKRRISWPLGFAAVCCAALFWTLPIDRWSYQWHAPGQRILAAESSARGSLLVVESHGQRQLLAEREPVLTVPDELAAEWMTHIPLALHPSPERVLVIGIAPSGSSVLMRSHGTRLSDEVVGDPRLARVVASLDPSKSANGARLVAEDERGWLRGRGDPGYDVAIVQSMPPTSVAGARLCSIEFYRDLHDRLAVGGMIVVKAPAHASYAAMEQRRMHSGMASTLRAVFSHVLVIPGPVTLYVASDSDLPRGAAVLALVTGSLQSRGVVLSGATRSSLSDATTPHRLADAERWAALPMPASTDTHPIAYRLALEAVLAQVGEGGTWALRILALMGAVLAMVWFSPRSRPAAFAVATTGFAGLALQLLLMLVYQTAAAALYRDVALVNAAFMAASCAGTWWAGRSAGTRRALLLTDLSQLALAAGLALGMGTTISAGPTVSRVVVLLGACAIGLVSGAQIALASRTRELAQTGTGGTVFAIDLFGAAFAAVLTYTLAVPMLGLTGAALAVAIVKATSSVALLVRPAAQPSRGWAVPGPAVALLVFVILGTLEGSERVLSALTVSKAFSLMVVGLLIALLAYAFQPRYLHQRLVAFERWSAPMRKLFALPPSRLVELVVLLPLGALPLSRCYFKVPFLFCHTCPRPCTFGILRPYLVPAALLANLDDRRFCEKACPFGQAQRACERSRERRLRTLGRYGWGMRLIVLAALALLYPIVLQDRRESPDGSGVFSWLYTNAYATSATVLGVSALLLIASFFVRRPFCDALCPIGAASDLVARAERRWLVRRQQADGTTIPQDR